MSVALGPGFFGKSEISPHGPSLAIENIPKKPVEELVAGSHLLQTFRKKHWYSRCCSFLFFSFLFFSFFLALSSSLNSRRKCVLMINEVQKRKDALDGVLTCQTWIDAESLLVFRLLPFTVAYLALFNPICA